MYHEHPIRILRYSIKNIWLLIFPLLRGISTLHFKAEDLYIWLKGAWFDIAVICVILLFGFIRWNFSTITINENEVIYREGVIFRIYTSIPLSSISVITAERPLYLIPFSGVKLNFDTRAGIFKTTDMKILITEKVFDQLMIYIPNMNEKKKIKGLPDTDAFSVILFSVFFSSGFSGAVYIATFFFKGGSITRNLITESLSRITETTELITQKILFVQKIPAAAVAVGIVFLVAWFLSFIVNLFRYSRFDVDADDKFINVVCGITNRRTYRIRTNHINYTDLRQNLIMKIFGAVTVNISCAGFGSDSQYLPVLLPIKLEKNLGTSLEKIGVFSGIKPNFRPKPTSIFNYIWQPLFFGFALIPLYHLMNQFFPKFHELEFFLAVMLAIPSIWLVIIKITALFTSGISVYDDTVTVRCSKWTAFHTVTTGKENVIRLDINQTIFQKLTNNKCRVTVWLCGETSAKYTVRALSMKDALAVAKLLEHNSL